MTSPPLDSTHGWQRRAWHHITAIGKHTRSDDIERGMASLPYDSTHGQTMSGVARHHRLLTAHTVAKRRAWHAIIAFGLHTQSNNVGRGMPSSPLGSTNGRTTSSVASHHHFWTAHTINNVERGMRSLPLESTHGRQRRAWHDITVVGQHTRSEGVGRGMPSSPLDGKRGRTTLGVACIITFGKHTGSKNVGYGIPPSPLGSTND